MEKHPQKKSAIVSVHDVMPSNLSNVCETIGYLKSQQVTAITLFVVPGKAWADDELATLKKFENEGVELAGHGWQHLIYRVETFWHRIHGKIISRDEGEHLSLTGSEIAEIIEKCYKWFDQSGFRSPLLYVPPAWAMGAISRKQLTELPFRCYETVTGLYDSQSGKKLYMPITGYMADAAFRVLPLRIINRLNLALPMKPVRITIHPDDLYLPMKKDLTRHLARFNLFLRYRDIIE